MLKTNNFSSLLENQVREALDPKTTTYKQDDDS